MTTHQEYSRTMIISRDEIEWGGKYTPTPLVQAWCDEVLALATRADAEEDPMVQRAIRMMNANYLNRLELNGMEFYRAGRTIENLLGEQP